MIGVIDLPVRQSRLSQALRPSVVTGNGNPHFSNLRSSLGIALHGVRNRGRVPPISAGWHPGITPGGRSLSTF